MAKLNDIDPQDWLAGVLGRLPAHPAKLIHELNPGTAVLRTSLTQLKRQTSINGPRGPNQGPSPDSYIFGRASHQRPRPSARTPKQLRTLA
ncbi:transposase domain-containing protein [Bradyrhizobium sp. RDI18]|uniref:transposase domain-containing protein n=1 Tax=Bradyrhizobium sp. RDI18 TaxID=3367400 RepID=UPI003722155B